MTELTVTVHRSVQELNERRWNTTVEQSRLGSCFQRTEWLAVIEAGLELEPRHVTVERDGNLVGVCPNFVSELRLPEAARIPGREYIREVASTKPGFGGPVIASDERDTLEAITDAVGEVAGPGVVSHYLRTGETGYLRYAQALDVLGYAPYVLNCRFVIDLSKGKDQIVADMDKDRRYNIRKAKENDPEVREASLDPGTMGTFYERYEQVMDRVGGQTYPRSFFDALLEHFRDRVLLLVADVDGSTVGWHLYLRDEERSALHHLFSVVLEEHFRYYPSAIIHDRALDRALDAGHDTYDFGETGAHFDDGLFKYKEQYGGRLVPTITWERGLSLLWPIYARGRGAYRRWNSEYSDRPSALGSLGNAGE